MRRWVRANQAHTLAIGSDNPQSSHKTLAREHHLCERAKVTGSHIPNSVWAAIRKLCSNPETTGNQNIQEICSTSSTICRRRSSAPTTAYRRSSAWCLSPLIAPVGQTRTVRNDPIRPMRPQPARARTGDPPAEGPCAPRLARLACVGKLTKGIPGRMRKARNRPAQRRLSASWRRLLLQ